MAIEFYYRGRKCQLCNKPMPIFGFGHYIPKELKEDEFSKNLNYFYLYGSESNFNHYLKLLVDFYNKRIKDDRKFDFVCVSPSHAEGQYNPRMLALAEKFAAAIGIPYQNVLRRIKVIQQFNWPKVSKEKRDAFKSAKQS